MSGPGSRDVVRDRLIKVTGEAGVETGILPPVPLQPDPQAAAAQRESQQSAARSLHQTMFGTSAQPPLSSLHTSVMETGVRSTTSTGSRLQLPGELPDRLREVDLKLASERTRAVDIEEIAAYLEADGLGDEILRDRYGAKGLFDAAEMLYRQKGTGGALDHINVASPATFPWTMLLRGPLYLLPGLAGLLIAGALGKGAEIAFVLAAAYGWGWTMTVAGVRYAEPFAVPGRALRLTLLISAGAGLLGGGLIALWAAGPQAVLLGTLVGGAVALSSGAAGVLLSLSQLGQFAGAFASPLLAAGIVMAVPSVPAALFALALLAVVPTLTALNATRAPGTVNADLATLRPYLPHAVYGWSMAAAFVALSVRLGTWPLLPVILGAGLLEASVWYAQERLQIAARTHRTLAELRRVGVPTVLLGAAGYGVVLGAVLVVLSLLPLPIGLDTSLVTITLYSAALMLSSWLANQRRTGILTVIWALGAAALVLGLSPPLFALLTLLAMLVPALQTLSDPRSYR
ncbi:hypothetical protein [Deinococcus arenicola]|uniref:Uncharacterized protein n=1 Tax=Deinococcus arenicola TaxID=2994950 RepID=A0ABU4DS71_9DEIO|nr:hypothetical protein [Deinococcus sp. ZS9-10]MDV6375273.1 hypothetical protein [Deinococcus sp. ZS9-10]